MEAFDCVGRVDQLTNRWVVFKIRAELCPVIPPRGDDNGILFAPLLVKGIKLLFSEFFRGRLIDFFEFGQEWLLIFTGNILQAVSDLMHNTALNLSFREGRLNRFSQTSEFINPYNSHTLQSAVPHHRENADPDLRTHPPRDIHT